MPAMSKPTLIPIVAVAQLRECFTELRFVLQGIGLAEHGFVLDLLGTVAFGPGVLDSDHGGRVHR